MSGHCPSNMGIESVLSTSMTNISKVYNTMFYFNSYDVAEMRIAYNIRLSQVIVAADPAIHIVSWQDFDNKFYEMLR